MKETKSERFNMFLTPSEKRALEEYCYDHRIRSTSEAVRRMIRRAIEEDKRNDKS